MTRIRLVFAAVALVAAMIVAPAAEAKTVLKGTVGPGFTITLKNAAGKKVTTLKRGVYVIQVSDKSGIHNFRLRGPGLNKRITTVPFTGSKSVTVTLKAGKYTYVCDPHASSMRGSFRVT
jgi:plastocyanin